MYFFVCVFLMLLLFPFILFVCFVWYFFFLLHGSFTNLLWFLILCFVCVHECMFVFGVVVRRGGSGRKWGRRNCDQNITYKNYISENKWLNTFEVVQKRIALLKKKENLSDHHDTHHFSCENKSYLRKIQNIQYNAPSKITNISNNHRII